jgi:stearoyl-CoA desaturase (delta-9 desaturase)
MGHPTAHLRESTVLPVANPVAELPVLEPAAKRIALGLRLANLVAVIVPFLGLVAAIGALWGWGFYWADLGLLLGMYLLTALGITVGFHRLFTHRSFETSGFIQFIFGVLGSIAVQGPLLKWVALHRRHHQHSDDPKDPHSPHHQGKGVRGLLRGVWHAHIGWIFDPAPLDLLRYVPDLEQSRTVRTISALFPGWVAAGLLIPAILGALISGTWTGALRGFVWGGLVRVFLVHHVTWSVNSICHIWGRQPFRSDDQSRNNAMIGVLSLGEGWHNTHHAFPISARHGLSWWQIDVSYWVIRALASLGLARNVKLPSEQAIARQHRQ